jgi:hypothetical protein
VSNPGGATVTISGNGVAPAGTLAFSSAGYSVSQTAGTVSLSVSRTGGSGGAVTVNYSTSDGSAVAGPDFKATNGTLSWASGDSAPKSISVPLTASPLFSGTKSFTVVLSTSGGGASLGSPTSASVSIVGGASAAVGSLKLSSATYTVNQTSGSVTIYVGRTGGSSGAVSVDYQTNNGSAASGTNYTAASGTLNWAGGDASTKTIAVPINQTPFTGTKTFTISLSGPTGGASLSTPSSGTISISGSGVATPPPPANGASWVYYQGKFDWAGDWNSIPMDYSYGSAGVNGGGPVIEMPGSQQYQYWLPYPQHNFNGPASNGTNFSTVGFTKFTIAFKPSQAGLQAQMNFYVASGATDDIVFGNVVMITQAKYGPAVMTAGEWNVYTVPLTDFGLAANGQWIYKFIVQQQGNTPQTVLIDQVGFLP